MIDGDQFISTVEGEEALLGSILIAGGIIRDLDWLKPEHFFLLKHGWIYDAMWTLYKRGEEIDNVTLADELRKRGQLKEIGGPAYITLLINRTPTHIHYYTYAAMIQETFRRREIMKLAGELATAAKNGDRDRAALVASQAKEMLEAPADDVADLRPYLIHASDLENLPPVTWLIPGEIPERGLTMYFGPSGVGKSFVALDVALRLSQTIPVVYIAAEGEYGFAARVAAWCKHNKKQARALKIYFFMNVVSLIDDKERTRFITLISRIAPRMIVVDTVAHCMLPGNENDTREMGMFVKGTKAMQKKFDCAALLVHHTNKGGKVERGNQSLRNACDVIARITDDDDIICFECSKSKDSSPFETRYLRLLPIELETYPTTPIVIAAEKAPQTKEDPLTRKQRKVLETLQMSAYEGGLTRSDLCELTEISNGSMGRILSALKKFGYITQDSKRDRYMPANPNDSVDSVDSHDSRVTSGNLPWSESDESSESSESRTVSQPGLIAPPTEYE
jgi:hypothetical protein